MEAIKHLSNVLNNRAAFVPSNLAPAIVDAARALGFTLCGGMYDPETRTQVLYIA